MPIIVIELKWNKSADSAIKQIKKRHYPQALEGIEQDILLVGINYDVKTKNILVKLKNIVDKFYLRIIE